MQIIIDDLSTLDVMKLFIILHNIELMAEKRFEIHGTEEDLREVERLLSVKMQTMQ